MTQKSILLRLMNKCNVCYTLDGTNKLSKTHAAINDDSKYNQVNSIFSQ